MFQNKIVERGTCAVIALPGSPAFGCAINKEALEQRSSQICLCISWCPYKEKIRAEAIEARAKYEKVESTYLNIC